MSTLVQQALYAMQQLNTWQIYKLVPYMVVRTKAPAFYAILLPMCGAKPIGYINESGHRLIRVAGQYKQEHRVIIEQSLGRILRRDEFVHHRNGNPSDNRLCNLEIMTPTQHRNLHNHWRRLAAKQRLLDDKRRLLQVNNNRASLRGMARTNQIPRLLARLAPGVGVRQLARRTKLDAGFVSRIFNRHHTPSLATAQRIAKGVGCTLDRLHAVLRPRRRQKAGKAKRRR